MNNEALRISSLFACWWSDSENAAPGYSTALPNVWKELVFISLKKNVIFTVMQKKLLFFAYRQSWRHANANYKNRHISVIIENFRKIIHNMIPQLLHSSVRWLTNFRPLENLFRFFMALGPLKNWEQSNPSKSRLVFLKDIYTSARKPTSHMR